MTQSEIANPPMTWRKILGSARASRAGDGALAIANSSKLAANVWLFHRVDCGEAPQSTREARALPRPDVNSHLAVFIFKNRSRKSSAAGSPLRLVYPLLARAR